MSITMLARAATRNSHTQHESGAQFEPAVKALLDHIAAELAAEYVRLMETAAQAGDPSSMPSD